VVFAAELVGGVMLVLGVYARWVALALVPILIGAATVHWGNGWVFDNRRGGWEFPVFWAVALVVQFLIGDGSHALKRSRVARAWTGTLARTAAAPGAGPARG
jgi:putative oxidoreductase